MPIPPNAQQWDQQLDPKDKVDYIVDISDMLEAGETVSSSGFTMSAEGTALGVQIGTAGYAVSQPTPESFRVWLMVDSGFQSNAAFDGAGTLIPITMDITTNSTPNRVFQRTLVVQVAQQ